MRIDGKEIEVPVIDIDAYQQIILKDKGDALLLHSKLRRVLLAKSSGNRDEASMMAIVAQKVVEKQKLESALSNMQNIGRGG